MSNPRKPTALHLLQCVRSLSQLCSAPSIGYVMCAALFPANEIVAMTRRILIVKSHRSRVTAFVSALLLGATGSGAHAATGVILPPWVCAQPDAIFVSGFEDGEIAVPHHPSSGSGGAYPGDQTRAVTVPGFGSHNYYLHVPSDYIPSRSWPLVIALEGAGGSPAEAVTEAQTIRSQWGSIVPRDDYVVIVPIASGAQGGWIPPDLNGNGPSDYDVIAAAIADTESAYNIELTRRHAWGYSAGGIILHDLVLTGWSGINANTFGAYAVTGAPLAGCPTYNTVQSCVPANAARIIPLDIRIGTSDPALPYVRNDKVRFLNAGWVLNTTLYYTEFVGGHTYSTNDLTQDWGHFCPRAVVP
jgi:poly(3-hydroxybutyrate) depolymerase